MPLGTFPKRISTGIRRLRPLIGVLIAACCVCFLWSFPWGASLHALASASVPVLLVAVLAKLAALGMRVERTRALMHRELRMTRKRLAMYVLCRCAADNLLAGWTGVGVQAWLLTRKAGVRLSTVAGAIGLEKSLDVVVVWLGVGVVLDQGKLPLPIGEAGFRLVFVLSLVALAMLIAYGRLGGHRPGARFLEPLARPFGTVWDGARIVGSTAMLWAAEALVMTLCMRASGVTVGTIGTILLTTAGAIAMVVPGVPTGAGTVEVGVVLGLRALGTDPVQALASALLYHIVVVVPEVALGIVGLRGVGIGLGDMRTLEPENTALVSQSGTGTVGETD